MSRREARWERPPRNRTRLINSGTLLLRRFSEMGFRNFVLALVTAAPLLFSQSPEFTSSSVGMQMMLIRPGSMQVGVYHPTCPDPNGRGGGRGAFGPGPNGGN